MTLRRRKTAAPLKLVALAPAASAATSTARPASAVTVGRHLPAGRRTATRRGPASRWGCSLSVAMRCLGAIRCAPSSGRGVAAGRCPNPRAQPRTSRSAQPGRPVTAAMNARARSEMGRAAPMRAVRRHVPAVLLRQTRPTPGPPSAGSGAREPVPNLYEAGRVRPRRRVRPPARGRRPDSTDQPNSR